MVITLPHTKVISKVVNPLKEFELEQYIMLSNDSYASMMQLMWDRKEPFINVEHDVVVTQERIQEIWNCPRDWCSYGYTKEDKFAELTCVYFGCVKFNRGIIEAIPHVWEEMVDRNWWVIDCYFTQYARSHGLKVHQHFPHVEHLK